jgi:hypothetical protein
MAFPASAGYTNLPNGNWSPVIYSRKALMFFRTTSVAQDITNSDYSGEIKAFGDTVRIIKEPVITQRAYKRGTKIEPQDLADEDLSLVIDQANYVAFAVDDIEKSMSHIAWEGMAVSSGGYALRNAFDQEVLSHMYSNATAGSNTGTDGAPKTIGFGAGNDFSPSDYISRFATILDENDIPEEGRYIVANPSFYEALRREDSKLIEVSVTGDAESLLRNYKLGTSKQIHGFTMYKSNNLSLSASSRRVILAGHKSAVATANSVTESEKMRRESTFGDMYRSLLVYGRKVLRPEALFSGHVTIGDV